MELRGEATELFTHDTAQTVVVEGGANCSKTHTICAWVAWLCETVPRLRVLFLRKVRADCITSVCIKPWEDHIIDLHLEQGTVRVIGGEQRKEYRFVDTGAVVVPSGLDKVSRHMGAGWDIVVFFEATETKRDEYEYISTRVSREPTATGRPSVIVLDVNPVQEGHYINQLALRGEFRRLCAKHEDNPLLFDREGNILPQGREYLGRLHKLTGARKRRLLFHEWCTEEGLVWPEYDKAVHRVARSAYANAEVLKITAGFDWGHTEPGCLEVFALIEGGLVLRIFELYRTGLGYPAWGQRIAECDDLCRSEWGRGIDVLVGSHEQPAALKLFDEVLQSKGKRPITQGYKARPGAERARIERVRWFLDPYAANDPESPPTEPGPRLFLLSGSDWLGPDSSLLDDMAPTSWETEIEGLVWEPTPDGRRGRERPDPKCPNHACDSSGMGLEPMWEEVKLPPRQQPMPRANHAIVAKDREAFEDLMQREARGRRWKR